MIVLLDAIDFLLGALGALVIEVLLLVVLVAPVSFLVACLSELADGDALYTP